MRITWLGAAGFEIRTKGTVLLIDPYLTRNPRARPALDLRPSDLGQAHAIFLSHGHFDHAFDVPEIAARSGARVYCGSGVDRVLRQRGVAPERLEVIYRDGQEYVLPELEARAFFSRHVRFDAALVVKTLARRGREIFPLLRLNRAYPRGQVLAWRFRMEGKLVLHFGSAGATAEELARLSQEPVDLLLTPLQGHSRITDICYAQAAALRPRSVVIHHHDDFHPPLSRYIDPAPLRERVARELPGTRVIVPELNQPLTL